MRRNCAHVAPTILSHQIARSFPLLDLRQKLGLGPSTEKEAGTTIGTWDRAEMCWTNGLGLKGRFTVARINANLGNRFALGRNDAGDGGEVVGHGDIAPAGGVEEWLNGGKAVMAEFENEEAAGLEILRGLRNECAVEFVTFFAAIQGGRRFVLADFDGQGVGVAKTDVGRVADDEIERK